MIAVIAPHPVESPEDFREVLDDLVRVYPNLDSYDLLSGCSAHISLSSTLLIEAILYGKPSYQIDLGPEKVQSWNLDDLVDSGINKKIKMGQFPKLIGEDFLPVTPDQVKYFFESSSLQQLIKLT